MDTLTVQVLPKPTGDLRTIFEKELDSVIEARKKDAYRPIQELSPSDNVETISNRLYDRGICAPENEVSVPHRPKWSKTMSREELDNLEHSEFDKWLASVYSHNDRGELNAFEHNLEVWRQIWRCIERSDIMMLLLDARWPLLFFHRDLYRYIVIQAKLPVVIVLNKTDLVSSTRIRAWKVYLHKICPDIKIVKYSTKESGKAALYRTKLLDALASCYVRRNGREVPARPFFTRGSLQDDQTALGDRPRYSYVVVGILGEPNMGKSSLLNSVVGKTTVSCSATPGHTKHFQTIFLTKHVCFCDSPGIVLPRKHVPRDIQILFGQYRIAQVREPYSAIRFLAENSEPGMIQETYHLHQTDGDEDDASWSPYSIAASLAEKKAFHTKRGRPDTFRAANLLLRDVLKGEKLQLSFSPPSQRSGSHVGPTAPTDEAHTRPIAMESSCGDCNMYDVGASSTATASLMKSNRGRTRCCGGKEPKKTMYSSMLELGLESSDCSD